MGNDGVLSRHGKEEKKVHKILIWGVGLGYHRYINAMRYQELLGEICIIGVTGKDEIYDYLDGYKFISIHNIGKTDADFIVVTSEKYFSEIIMEAKNLGFAEDIILLAKAFMVPGFLFSKYADLIHSRISIIANNCWGGTIYNTLGMKFRSPFINMFVEDMDYLKLLRNLKYYLGKKPEFVRYGYNPDLQINYPICKLDDIELHFNHYTNIDEAEINWNKRVNRINWNNILVMMYTVDEQAVWSFQRLDYEKKVCFVPFDVSIPFAYCLQIAGRDVMQDVPFGWIVNKIASGHFHDYDLIDLLNTGKEKQNRYFSLENDKFQNNLSV